MEELIIKKSISINATPETVWEVLTNPHITKKYMYGSRIKSNWIPGGSVEWIGEEEGKDVTYVKEKIIEVIPEKILRLIVFHPDSGSEQSKDYLDLTYELQSLNRQTELTIVQGDFNRVTNGEKRFKDTFEGWSLVLPKIKEIAESR